MLNKTQDIRGITLTFLGAGAVGKTSFMKRWLKNEALQDPYQATVGLGFFVKTDVDKKLKFQCFDTGGQERYRTLSSVPFRDADILVFMFDVTAQSSLDALSGLISDAKKMRLDPTRFILVANKIDQMEQRIITDLQASDFALEHGIVHYVSASVKTGEGMVLFQETIEGLALSLPIEPKPIIPKTLPSALRAEIETLEKLYTDNPRRGGRVAVQAIANILKKGAVAEDAQKYFDAKLAELKQHFNTLQLTWRSVVNTVLNVVFSALIALTVVGFPLLYCCHLWKPNKDSLQPIFRSKFTNKIPSMVFLDSRV